MKVTEFSETFSDLTSEMSSQRKMRSEGKASPIPKYWCFLCAWFFMCVNIGVWRCGRQGEERGGSVSEWAVDEVCCRMEGGVIQAYVG